MEDDQRLRDVAGVGPVEGAFAGSDAKMKAITTDSNVSL